MNDTEKTADELQIDEPHPGPDALSGSAINEDEIEPLDLVSLAPDYQIANHGIYYKTLVRAIDTDGTRNIAVTGAYGTGKSSILARVAKHYGSRTLEISLSTVDPDAELGGSRAKGAIPTTNLIQKEIVKQILYRDEPSRTRGSRFRRLARFHIRREAGLSAAVALLAVTVFVLSGANARMNEFVAHDATSVTVAHFAVGVLVGAAVFALRWLTHNRLLLERFNAGPATVTVTNDTSSYFDQYLDEIVYFFEQSGRDVVLFEDIDRFENVHVFETLRSLNTIINGSQQVIRRRGQRRVLWWRPAQRDVVFVYALRDSVFEAIGESPEPDGEDAGPAPEDAVRVAADDRARSELERANRTKFFDLVMPVVPFITHRNARDLLIQRMEPVGVSRPLCDLAASHVADQRLIINMRNEYDVYASKLLHGSIPGLDPDRLFALILFKNIHLSDFERIRFGDSSLDRLYDAWRQIVDASIATRIVERRRFEDEMDAPRVSARRATDWGARLKTVVAAIGGQEATVQVGRTAFSASQLVEVEFWALITDTTSRIILNGTYGSIPIEKDALSKLLGIDLSPEVWMLLDERDHSQRLVAIDKDLLFLQHHTWAQIAGKHEFSGDVDGVTLTFSKAVDTTLESMLARQLVRRGYLDDYFAHYVSVYYGEQVRPAAMRFIRYSLELGRRDFNAELSREDVDAMLDEKGAEALVDRSAYNRDLLDHLFAHHPDQARALVELMHEWGPVDRDFVDLYLARGRQPVELVRLLAPRVPQIFKHLLGTESITQIARLNLLDTALRHSSSEIRYDLDGVDLGSAIVPDVRHFSSITSADALPEETRAAMSTLATAGVLLLDVAPLNPVSRESAIESAGYVLTAENLRTFTGQENISLDKLRDVDTRLFDRAARDLPGYIAAVQGSATTQRALTGGAALGSVLNDIGKMHEPSAAVEDHVEALLAHVESDAIVRDLSDVDSRFWPVLVAHSRTEASVANITFYLGEYENVDASLQSLLEQSPIVNVEVSGQATRRKVAIAVLNARTMSIERRIALVVELNLDAPIDAGEIVAESGAWVGLLLEAGVVADDELLFQSHLMVDWPTREAAFVASREAVTFISPDVLPPADMLDFLSSKVIPADLQRLVLGNWLAYMAGGDDDAYEAVAVAAYRNTVALSGPDLTTLLTNDVSRDAMIDAISVASVSLTELRSLLRLIGDDYSKVADVGRKRPLLPDRESVRSILDRLRRGGIVSGYKSEAGGVRVSLHHS